MKRPRSRSGGSPEADVQQLSGLDATFLNIETPTQHGHVGGVVIVDPSTAPGSWDFDTIHQLIEERIHLLPRFGDGS